MEIEWNGFLKKAVESFPKETCAFLFSSKPYSPEEKWIVFPVRNVCETPLTGWIPCKAETNKIKQKATKMGLVKIGNIHTHPITPGDDIEESFLPSDTNLRYARRFNDIIRGIIVVDNKAIYGIKLHDKFGNPIPIVVVDKQEEGH